MGDLVASKAPATFVTLGLGSCIGLALYDTTAKVGGLVHIMLPDSRGMANPPKLGKFADTAVPELIRQLEQLGGKRSRLKAKMAGGAQMFQVPGKQGGLLAVGAKNGEAVVALLNQHRIDIEVQQIGGSKGRSIEFVLPGWVLKIKTLGMGVEEF
ncbi:MAG: chemotaxis protein CheD [Synergistales bacterium]|nr:chemotaxis protein CheD [Synergistales bacterium]